MSLISKSHLRFILKNIKALLSKKADKEDLETVLDKSELVQSDWAQNDESAIDYIKNRTHYEEVNTFMNTRTITLDNGGGWMNITEIDADFANALIEKWADAKYEDSIRGVLTPFEGPSNDYWVHLKKDNDNYVAAIVSLRKYDDGTLLIGNDDGSWNSVTISLPQEETVIHHLDPKFIKDMYYEEEPVRTEVVPETSIEIIEEGDFIENTLPIMLQEGLTYVVNWNGTEYTCLARLDAYDNVYIGNQAISQGWDFIETIESDEPFFIATYEPDNFSIIFAEVGAHTFSISAMISQIHSIPEKYLPKDFVVTIVEYDEETGEPLVASHSSTEIMAAKREGKKVNLSIYDGIEFEDDGGDLYEYYFRREDIYSDEVSTVTICIQEDKSVRVWEENYRPATERIYKPTIGQTIIISELDEDKKYPVDYEAIDRHRFEDITLTDRETGYEYIVSIKNGTLISLCCTKFISVKTMPDKTEYLEGELFDPTGMVVIATRQDGTTFEADLSGYKVPVLRSPFTIEFVEAGISYTTTIKLTITPFDPAVHLIDFEYNIQNQNTPTTYYITGWKGTLNGVTSTECILPDTSLISM